MSPSLGGAFLLSKLTRERARLTGEECSSASTPSLFPGVERRDRGCSWGRGECRVPSTFQGETIRGPRSRKPAGIAGALTNLGLFFVSSSLAARFPAPRLLLRPTPGSSPPPPAPDADAPCCSIFLWPRHLPPRNPTSLQGQKPLGALRMSRVHGQRGLPAKHSSQAPGSPQSQATPTQPRWCHHSALGQALPLSSCNHHGRLRPQGGV